MERSFSFNLLIPEISEAHKKRREVFVKEEIRFAR
jgi:hypothetical protein